jgi:DNA-binding GntR family transcriptional regulator
LVTRAFDNLTLSQRVYDHLREEILSDRLPPGTELSEVAISTELEISRGPIREAMGRLASEGLIKVRPRRRAEVRSLTPHELIDAYEVREALEVLAVRLAVPRVSEADLTRLDQLIDQMADHAKANAIGDFFAANVEFHETLCELSGNSKLQEVHHRLEGEIGRFQARTLALRGSLDGSLTEHRAIIAAIRLRDADKAAALTAAHVRVPAERLQATLAEGALPASTGPASTGPADADAVPAGAVTAVRAGYPG